MTTANPPRDLYKTLRLRSRSATKEQIAKAYRKLALKHHPDRGGDAEAFREIKLAYEVLSDDGRRAKYDATGEIDESRKPNENDQFLEIANVVTPILQGVFGSIIDGRRSPKTEDLAQHIRNELNDIISRVRFERPPLHRAKIALADIMGRFTVEIGENILESITRTHLKQVEDQLVRIDAEEAKLKRVIAFMKTCKYRIDPANMSMGNGNELFRVGSWRAMQAPDK